MNYAIEIKNLSKSFGGRQAVSGLNMTVPRGAVYGFIGENGSGKSTTEKMVCGLLPPDEGTIRLFGQDYKDGAVRSRLGALIEMPGCFPNRSVWNNMRIQAANLDIRNPDREIARVLKIVRMEGSASCKFKNCSLGMKQRIGVAFALLGNPALLVLDEPLNGLDADGMRIMREVLKDITKDGNCTVLISSHILSELEKVATHYGIIRGGRMIRELSAEAFEKECRTYTKVLADDPDRAEVILKNRAFRTERNGDEIRVADAERPEAVSSALLSAGIGLKGISNERISLEEYYTDLMNKGGERV